MQNEVTNEMLVQEEESFGKAKLLDILDHLLIKKPRQIPIVEHISLRLQETKITIYTSKTNK